MQAGQVISARIEAEFPSRIEVRKMFRPPERIKEVRMPSNG